MKTSQIRKKTIILRIKKSGMLCRRTKEEGIIMLAQIFATAIFLLMFIFIVVEVVERHVVSLVCALLTIVLVFGLCMQDMAAIVDTINLKSLFTVEFWYHTGNEGGSSAGINWETIIFIFGMMVAILGPVISMSRLRSPSRWQSLGTKLPGDIRSITGCLPPWITRRSSSKMAGRM